MKIQTKYFFLILAMSVSFSYANPSNGNQILSESVFGTYSDSICDFNVLNEVIKFDSENSFSEEDQYNYGTIFARGELTRMHYLDVQKEVKEAIKSINYKNIDPSEANDYSVVTIINKKRPSLETKKLSENIEDQKLPAIVLENHRLAVKIANKIKFPLLSKKTPLIIRTFDSCDDTNLSAVVIQSRKDLEGQVTAPNTTICNRGSSNTTKSYFQVNGQQRFVIEETNDFPSKIIVDSCNSGLE
jgi:hypothetical protein